MKINVNYPTSEVGGETIQGEPTFEFEEFPHMQLSFPDHDVEITFDLTCNDLTLYILSTPIRNDRDRGRVIRHKEWKEVQIKLNEVDLPIEKDKGE